MKQLKVPYIPELDQLHSADEIASLLESRGTRQSLDAINWPKQFPYAPLTTFAIAHSGTAIYIDFFVRCNYLRAENSADQSPVHEDSCVEFFVSPHGDRTYFNFEYNCIGALHAGFRTAPEDPSAPKAKATPLTPEQLERVRRYASCGTRPFREMQGLFAWSLITAIPLDILGLEYTPGTPLQLTANFYKCAAATSAPHYLSWRPVRTPAPDFHRPSDFARLTLL